jgi:ketosteroid isomerase-like protein
MFCYAFPTAAQTRTSELPRWVFTKDEAKLMLREQAWEAAKDWCDAWNCRDLDGIMLHYADDVEFSSPTVVKRWGIADG